MEEVRSFLLELLEELHPDVDFENCDALVEDKVIDSFDIISLIAEVNDELDVVISAEKIIPENFNSVDAMCRMIVKLMDEE